jgi:diguanylate cyclase (GGDEF)-like protein/PAS domain S-box-containing protein
MPASDLPNAAGPGPGSPATLTTLQEQAMRNALDASDNAIVMSNTDRRVVYVNAGFTRLFGYPASEVLGKRLSETLFDARAEPGILDYIRHTIETEGKARVETLLYGKTGQPRWVSMVINASDANVGGTGGTITVLTDITLTKMHEVLQKRVLEGMVNELPLTELMTLVCREVERIAPEVTASILAVDDAGCLRPLAAPGLSPEICEKINGVRMGPFTGSCGTAAFRGQPVLTTDIATDPLWDNYRALFASTGFKACWSSPIMDHRGKVIGTFAFYFRENREPDELHRRLVDVGLHLCALAIERATAAARIHQLAFFDGLTGLPNRSMLRSSAGRALESLYQDKRPGALLFINLDRFKQVNDTLGHAAGDALLCEVATRLTQALRARDLIGRLSGDEFALLLSECTTGDAIHAAQRILDDLARPMRLPGHEYIAQASVGIAMYPDDGTTIDTLLRHADQAMNQAKSEQRHSLQLFSPEMNRRAQERARLERDLRHALAERRLTLHYQPQMLSTSPRTLHGVEALARWNHPERGAVPPSQFIPVAEEAGLIHELTLWVLEEACTQLALWRASGRDIRAVAVNLSGHSFHHPEFAQQISDTLARHQLHAGDLMLEITESVMMDARAETRANIAALHSKGFKLSLDDFGTGYSSLSYLHRLPISELKLDMAFVRDLTSSSTARALTVSVLSIAHSLEMVVVAEGVETAGQQQWLQAHGCPVMQGFLFGHPMPPGELEAWLDAAPRSGR